MEAYVSAPVTQVHITSKSSIAERELSEVSLKIVNNAYIQYRL